MSRPPPTSDWAANASRTWSCTDSLLAADASRDSRRGELSPAEASGSHPPKRETVFVPSTQLFTSALIRKLWCAASLDAVHGVPERALEGGDCVAAPVASIVCNRFMTGASFVASRRLSSKKTFATRWGDNASSDPSKSGLLISTADSGVCAMLPSGNRSK